MRILSAIYSIEAKVLEQLSHPQQSDQTLEIGRQLRKTISDVTMRPKFVYITGLRLQKYWWTDKNQTQVTSVTRLNKSDLKGQYKEANWSIKPPKF